MKGLGFNKTKADEVTGLHVFSDLLSRLNGKSEEDVEGDRRARLAMETKVYVDQRWGVIRFVSGGLLVGDTLKEESVFNESSVAPETDEKRGDKDELSKKERKSKKRKLADAEEQVAEADSKKQRKRRKEERRARKVCTESARDSTEDTNQGGDTKAKQKSKKSKSSSGGDLDAGQVQPGSADEGSRKKARKSKSKDKKPDVAVDEDAVEAGKRSKKDKRKKVEAEATESKVSRSTEDEDAAGSATATGASTPTGSGTGTSTPKGGRNFARSRFIAAKRQAMLDANSLKQVCALSAVVYREGETNAVADIHDQRMTTLSECVGWSVNIELLTQGTRHIDVKNKQLNPPPYIKPRLRSANSDSASPLIMP